MGQGKVTSNTIYPQNIAQNSQDLLKNCNTLHRSSSSIAFYSNSKGNGETTKKKCTNTQLRAISDSLERKSHIIPPPAKSLQPGVVNVVYYFKGPMNCGLNFQNGHFSRRSQVNNQTFWPGCRAWCGHCHQSNSLFCHWLALWRQMSSASQVCLLSLIQIIHSWQTGRFTKP